MNGPASIRVGGHGILGRLLALILVATAAPTAIAQNDDHSDILFIAIDDLNDWVGYIGGHPQTQTPNIDRLAARGMGFLRAQSPSAVCHASRTAILTGLQPSSSGIYGNGPDWRGQEVFEGKLTLPAFLRANGYTTKGAGKIFHAHTYTRGGLTGFNDPNGWDDFYPSIDRQLPDEFGPYSIPDNGGSYGRSFDWAGLVAEDYALADGQVVNWVSDQIGQDTSGPRFLAAGIYRPHLPWYVPQSYFDSFPLETIELPPHIDGDLEDLSETAIRSSLNAREIHQWLLDEDRWEEAVRAYLASIKYADAMVGRLLDALDASGRAERTIIVLWGDHGFHLGEKERWRKFTLWEESLHVPLIIVAPGTTQPGSTTTATVSLIDIYRTLAELTGFEVAEHVEGRSLVPLLENPSLEWDYPTLSTHGYENHAVVSNSFKYIRYADGSEELYDIRRDPNEWTNLAATAGYEAEKDALAEFLPANPAPNLLRPPPRGAGGPGGLEGPSGSPASPRGSAPEED